MAYMRKTTRAVLILVVWWLLIFAPISPFFLERHSCEPPPRRSANLPNDNAGAYSISILPLFCSEGHLRKPPSYEDVVRFLNPVHFLRMLAAFIAMVSALLFAMYVILIGSFHACNLGVHSALHYSDWQISYSAVCAQRKK